MVGEQVGPMLPALRMESYTKVHVSRNGYVEREMRAMEALFEAVKDEEFYAELVKLREVALKETAQ